MVEPPRYAEGPGEKERLALVGTLVSGLVHEVRNPLNAIRTHLEILGEDVARLEEGDGPAGRRIGRLVGEVDRLNRILTDFLEFARGGEVNRAPTDLSRLLAETATLIEPDADKNGVTVLLDAPETAAANVDPRAIKQVILNLALNGIKAMPGGGTLMIRLAESEDAWRIEVVDTGVGIEPKELPRIFDLFYSTHPGGTGIGLAMVKRMVEAHGGEVTVESEPGRGTAFRIRLPK